MKKNIGTQEAHIRTIAGVVVLLFALFIVDNPNFRILLAVIAAILAGTAYMRSCLIYTLLKRDTSRSFEEENPIKDIESENIEKTNTFSETETAPAPEKESVSTSKEVPEEESK